MSLGAIAISGGLDSLTAAWILRSQGHRLLGLHFLTGFETSPDPRPPAGATAPMEALARQLDIPLEVVDLSAFFRRAVVDYFTARYAAGLTPNPCLVCNPAVKFGRLLEVARERGAEWLATGHYARRELDAAGRWHLLRGLDRSKDQSYFLARLTAEQLAGSRFPLGTWTKEAVRRLARTQGLRPVAKAESQDVCFIRGRTYDRFLEAQPDFAAAPGAIVDVSGREIGRHGGLHRFTVGQRRGIDCPGPEAYYVVRLDRRRNRLVVGTRREALRSRCRVQGVTWIDPPDGFPLELAVQLRYRHKPVACRASLLADGGLALALHTPQAAVAPGQGAVFYRGDEVLGSGWIVPDEIEDDG
jgi:tRNA-specific 2-thiouridylase